ncbi:DUF3327 domain-containing protein [Actinomycetaceae bacterium TAE3-ERU4]|nr:DUF3327 domain-containing protein [Actinomycetaceae bacterium TAE3-ERU4]
MQLNLSPEMLLRAPALKNLLFSTEENLWEKLKEVGTPIPAGVAGRWVFFWRCEEENQDVERVHLFINRVTDKDHFETGWMQRIPGTNTWVVALDIMPGTVGTYSFRPCCKGQDLRPGPPPHDVYTGYLDGTSLYPPLIVDRGRGLSYYRTPATEQDSTSTKEIIAGHEWENLNKIATSKEEEKSEMPCAQTIKENIFFPRFAQAGNEFPSRPLYLYLPEGNLPPEAMLTIFDAQTWFGRLDLPGILKACQQSGFLPPIAVLGVAMETIPDRKATMGISPDFLDDLWEIAEKWAAQKGEKRGWNLEETPIRIISGESLGGLTSLYAAAKYPERYTHALAQSPSLWWNPQAPGMPHEFDPRKQPWIEKWARSLPETPSAQIALTAGALEQGAPEKLKALGQLLLMQGWNAKTRIYRGGHDYAWWSQSLVEYLKETLG